MATAQVDRAQQPARSLMLSPVQAHAQIRSFSFVRVIVGPFAVLILAGIVIDALLVSPGLTSSVVSSLAQVPGIALAGSGALLLAVAVVGGKWETRQLWQAYQQWQREQRIAKVTPLAS